MNFKASREPIERKKRKAAQPNVFIGGIHPELKPFDIFQYLSNFATVEWFEMPKDLRTGNWKGYAKAVMHPKEGVAELISQPLHWVKGHELGVKSWVGKTQYLQSKDEVSSRKLFVKYQPTLTIEKELSLYFSKFGEIESIDIKFDPFTNLPRQFCFIIFKRKEDAMRAAQFGPKALGYPKIWCELTTPKHLMEKEMCEEKNTEYKETMGSLTEANIRAIKFMSKRQSEIKSLGSLVAKEKNYHNKLVSNQPARQHPKNLPLTNKMDAHSRAHFHIGELGLSGFHMKNDVYLEGTFCLNYKDFNTGKVKTSTPFLDHQFKPTSKHYFEGSKFQLAENHRSADNVYFRAAPNADFINLP